MPVPTRLTYRAFLSYSHADAEQATIVHRQIEGFHVDKDLVGRETSTGPIPATLRPIFRDRDDFSGGHTLADATIAALDDSAALIVLCSTVAAGRPAVNEEVRLFRSRHPDRPVIPVIIEGTPPDNFPPALRYELAGDGSVTNRPITVLGPDLREHADGNALGLAKLVAGLLGLRTDEIVRRAEGQRRRRLRNWVTGLSVIAAALAGLAVWAELNRRIAVEQRLTATSRQLSAQSLTKAGDQFDLALLLAVAANRIKPTPEAKSILLGSLQRHQHLETFLHGHTAEVHQVAFSPDGRLLASVSGTQREDFTVRLWDVRSRQPVGSPLVGHKRIVTSVAFSPDGKLVASADESGTIILWDVGTRMMVGSPLSGHAQPVHVVAFSLDGRKLASGGAGGRNIEGTPDKGEVRLWDVVTQTQIGAPLTGHTSAVYGLAFTSDGKTMASASGGPIYFRSRSDYSIILWDMSAHSRRQELLGHKASVRSLTFTPDGEVLASGGADSSIRLWDVAAGKEIEVPEFMAPGFNAHAGAVVQMAFTSDGKALTLTSADTRNSIHARELSFTDREGQKALFGINSESKLDVVYDKVKHVALSPDGTRWAAAGCKRLHSNGLCIQGDITLWNKRPSSLLSRPLPETGYNISSVATSRDGKLIATGGCTDGLPADCTGGEVRLWDAATLGSLGAPLKGLHHDVNAIAFSPDSKVIAAGSCGKFAVQGSFIECQQGEVRFWNVETRHLLDHHPVSHLRQVERLAFGTYGKWMASSDGDRVVVWDVAALRPVGELASRGDYTVRSIVFSPDDTRLAASTCNKAAERTGAYEWAKSGCVEGAVRFWDPSTRQPVGEPLVGHTDVVTSIAYSPDGKTLVSAAGNFDGSMIVWDVRSGRKLGRPFVGHVTGIKNVLFGPDGTLLASASDGSDAHHYDIILWDAASRQAVGQPLSGHSSYISDIAFHPGGRILLSGAVDGKVLVWNIDLDEWLAAACQIANRDLDTDEWTQFVRTESRQKVCENATASRDTLDHRQRARVQ